jgi:hypothetical protein
MPTVLIGCKLSNGIILELIPPPPKDLKDQRLYPGPTGKRVTIKGANSLRTHKRQPSPASYAFATTQVDKDFWDAWYERNKDLDFVRTGMIFVAPNEREFNAIAKDTVDRRTNTEPLNPIKDPRLPKSASPGATVEADPEALARAIAQAPT